MKYFLCYILSFGFGCMVTAGIAESLKVNNQAAICWILFFVSGFFVPVIGKVIDFAEKSYFEL